MSDYDSHPQDDRSARMRQVIDECLRRRAEGKMVPDTSLIAEHPDLMPELAEELAKLRLIAAARRQADHGDRHELTADTVLEQDPMVTIGIKLGRYEIVAPLGAGGMGVVYRAKDERLSREVAIKVLPEHLAHDPVLRARFEREAKAVAALSHPNILAIHDYGTEQGVSFAVMELLEGETLRRYVGRSTLTWQSVVEIGVAIAEGLAAAHTKGIIHRDLKPENLFLTSDGRVKILDFGLARVEAPPSAELETGSYISALTNPSSVIGTVGYMSPEQVRGQPADARSDLFSLGSVLYELATGRRAFGRDTAANTMMAVLHDDAPQLPSSANQAPLELERVIHRCLEKNPEQRFQSALDLAFTLRAILSGSRAAKDAPSTVRRQPPRRQRKAIDSLAILPLANVSGDPNMEYLSDGITESLISILSQLPKLRVMARSTALRYKGREVDAQVVGRDLNVAAVLIGQLFQRGDLLIIKVELVDVADGSYLWGEGYKRRLSDVLAIEAEIAREISDKLRLRLTAGEKKRLAKHYTANTEAYQLYLMGRHHWNIRTPDGLKRGVEYFEQAIAKDANYALAYAGLADSYVLFSDYGVLPARQAFPRSMAAAIRALEIDDTLAEPHTVLACVKFWFDWDWLEAEKEFQRALELNPNSATNHNRYAYFLATVWERFDDALVENERARELDPCSLVINSTIGDFYCFKGLYDRGIDQYRETLKLDPNFGVTYLGLGDAYAAQGRYAEAIEALQRGWELSQDRRALETLGYAYAMCGQTKEAVRILEEFQQLAERGQASLCSIAVICAGLGQQDQAFQWLENAYENHDGFLVYLKVNPRLNILRPDPRFADLLRRVGLPL